MTSYIHGHQRRFTAIPPTEALRHRSGVLKTTATLVLVAFLSLTLQPLAIAVQLPDTTTPAKPQSNEEKLAKTLETLEARLEQLETKLTKKQDARQEKDDLKRLRLTLDDLDRQAITDFDKIGKHLKDKNLPQVIHDRHTQAVNIYKTEMATLKANVDEIDRAPRDADKQLKAKKAKEHLKTTQKKRGPKTKFDPNNLPTRALGPKRDNKPKLKKEDFMRAALFDHPHVKLAAHGTFRIDQLPSASDPAYIAATPDVVLSDAIRAKAEELGHSPIKIYQWVRNNIEWVPSWGSIQGSELTLRNLKGNSIDTASLLIALFRASDIPARYVHGTIEVPVDRFMNWSGGFVDANSAWDFVSSGGVPLTGLISGGRVTAFRMEHVWVEAAIDFQPSRGATNKSADSWIALDASYKKHDITPGFDVTTALPFDANTYLGEIRSQSPVAYYQQQIQNYLNVSMPEKTVGDAMGYLLIKPDESATLPSALPNRIVVAANRYGILPDTLRTSVQLAFAAPNAEEPEIITFKTVELAGKRLTISYLPASASDEATIAQYGGDMYAVPPYLLYLTPTLKADGVTVYQATPIQMGQEHSLIVAYDGSTIRAQSVPHKLVSGGYFALGLNLQGANHHVLGSKSARLIEALTTSTAETASQDALIGEHLTTLILMWFMSNDSQYRGAAKLYRVAAQRALSAGFAGFGLTVRYFFGIPRSAIPNRAQFDVGLEATQAASLEGNASNRNAYLELHGLMGSYNEHGIWEAIHGFESVSAVKGLQFANAQGIPVYTITQSNFDQFFPLLQLAADDKDEIWQAVQSGLVAIVPQRESTINDWTGVGFIVKDPQTHSGVYRISGGLAGGSSTKQADGWQIVSLFKGAFAWLFDRLDTIFRGSVKEAAESMYAENAIIGDPRIANAANEKLGEGYEDVFQCSGLVRIAYKAAGICLDFDYSEDGAWQACWNPPSVAAQAGVVPGPTDNGVKIHYNIANALKQNNSVRKTNDPLVGDIVFFSNTTGPGHPLNHEGIVVTGPDNNGKIEFIHAGGSGVNKARMNILSPADPVGNSFIADPKRCGSECRAGQLFEGYGTIRDPRTLKK